MNSGRGLSPLWFLALLFLVLPLGAMSAEAQSFAYITARPSFVTVINTSTDNVVATVTVGNDPFGVVITPDGISAYVANSGSGSVSVIDTTSRTVVATIIVGGRPQAIAFTPDGSRAYVTNSAGSPLYVSVIDTSSRAAIATVPVGGSPFGVAITVDGTAAYVVNAGSDLVQVIDTASNIVVNEIPVGGGSPGDPFWIAMTPDGSCTYVTNSLSQNVAVIDTASQSVVATIDVGGSPFGVAFTPDGSRAYVTASAADSSTYVAVIDVPSASVVDLVVPASPGNSFGLGVAVTPDGSRVYATGSCGGCSSVQVIDTASDPVVDIVAPLDNSVGVAITPRLSEGGPRLSVFSKVVVIVLENTEFDEIIDNPDAPFFNQLAGQYGLAVNYFAITHPSFPNYLATTGGDTFGITEDCEDLSVCNRPEPFPSNLADQIEASGRSWVAYMEDMPEPCYIGSSDLYGQKHNPFIYFDTIRLRPERCANIQPYDPAGLLADFTWITPNLCNDMHDCRISTGDAWLRDVVSGILAQPEFQADGSGVLFITFDEGFGQNRVATLVIGPLVKPGYQSNVSQNHYSLLRTIEESWGLPLLRNAGDPSLNNMGDFFVRSQGEQTQPAGPSARPSRGAR